MVRTPQVQRLFGHSLCCSDAPKDELSIKNGVMISLKFALLTVIASHFMGCLWFSWAANEPSNNWALSYCIWADKDFYNDGCQYDLYEYSLLCIRLPPMGGAQTTLNPPARP